MSSHWWEFKRLEGPCAVRNSADFRYRPRVRFVRSIQPYPKPMSNKVSLWTSQRLNISQLQCVVLHYGQRLTWLPESASVKKCKRRRVCVPFFIIYFSSAACGAECCKLQCEHSQYRSILGHADTRGYPGANWNDISVLICYIFIIKTYSCGWEIFRRNCDQIVVDMTCHADHPM